jgi:adenine C2-methylase RlmN of 23S rRNA A2503 and tRNA A37
MRVGQLWNWIYHYGVRDFSAMTTIGKGLRRRAQPEHSRSTCQRSQPSRFRPTAPANG